MLFLTISIVCRASSSPPRWAASTRLELARQLLSHLLQPQAGSVATRPLEVRALVAPQTMPSVRASTNLHPTSRSIQSLRRRPTSRPRVLVPRRQQVVVLALVFEAHQPVKPTCSDRPTRLMTIFSPRSSRYEATVSSLSICLSLDRSIDQSIARWALLAGPTDAQQC